MQIRSTLISAALAALVSMCPVAGANAQSADAAAGATEGAAPVADGEPPIATNDETPTTTNDETPTATIDKTPAPSPQPTPTPRVQTPTASIMPLAAAAVGGVKLLEAMEDSRLTLVGRVGDIEKLDAHGYGASVTIESTLGDPAQKLQPGTQIRIAWEELARARPVRFQEQDRILVCLEKLPSASLWRKRFPNSGVRRMTSGIAMNGDAFLRDPSLGSIDLLHHYLSLPSKDRETEAGIAFLLSLAARAELPVAVSATRRMTRISSLEGKLGANGPAPLIAAVLRQDVSDALAVALIELIETHRPDELGSALQQAVGVRADSEMAPPHVYRALGASLGFLPKLEAEQLQRSDDPRYRRIAAHYAAGAEAGALLRDFFYEDNNGGVRATALIRLLDIQQVDALDTALEALGDPDPQVRRAAARGAAELGEAGATGLRAVAFGTFARVARSEVAARSAIGGLTMAGTSGRKTLIEIARKHPDKALRRLAMMGLGKGRAHDDEH